MGLTLAASRHADDSNISFCAAEVSNCELFQAVGY